MDDLLEEFYEYLLKKRLSENSIKAYLSDLKDFKLFIDEEGIDFLKVNTEVLYRFAHRYLINKSTATITRKINTIKKFYKFLLHKNYKIDKAVLLYNAPILKRKTPEFLTEEEIGILINLPNKDSFKGLRDRALIEILYGTGLKVNEIIDLSVKDIDLAFKVISCNKGKNQRVIPLGDKSVLALGEYLEARKDINKSINNLFLNNNYDILTRQGIWKIVKYYINKAGINKDINLNTFRHSFALHLLQNGADINIIQELLGLKGVNVLQIYLDVLPKKKLREIYNKSHPRA
ncbi:tyrosine-type recombinase/integrase [Alloiococcus sp. CFN-8]|uniref:tyrosine-type recombinase/integrase n=1 Tax=Alloiococcus sp. CFN-8 TaxID=3416081 RepID=UPI003CF46481